MENATFQQAASLLAALSCAALGCGGVAARAMGVPFLARWSKTLRLVLTSVSQSPQVMEMATAGTKAATGAITKTMDSAATVIASAAVTSTRRHACAAGYGEETWAFQMCLLVPSDAQQYTVPIALLAIGFGAMLLCTVSLCGCVCCYVCYTGAYWGAKDRTEPDPHGAVQEVLGQPFITMPGQWNTTPFQAWRPTHEPLGPMFDPSMRRRNGGKGARTRPEQWRRTPSPAFEHLHFASHPQRPPERGSPGIPFPFSGFPPPPPGPGPGFAAGERGPPLIHLTPRPR